jgi:hypothetical protein
MAFNFSIAKYLSTVIPPQTMFDGMRKNLTDELKYEVEKFQMWYDSTKEPKDAVTFVVNDETRRIPFRASETWAKIITKYAPEVTKSSDKLDYVILFYTKTSIKVDVLYTTSEGVKERTTKNLTE